MSRGIPFSRLFFVVLTSGCGLAIYNKVSLYRKMHIRIAKPYEVSPILKNNELLNTLIARALYLVIKKTLKKSSFLFGSFDKKYLT